VIAHADTETSGNPVKDNKGNDGRPAPEKKRRYCTKMEAHEEKPHVQITISPIDLGLAAHGRGLAIVL
jgi:hypothetical protein